MQLVQRSVNLKSEVRNPRTERSPKPEAAFTRADLVAVAAMLALLALFFLPARATTQGAGRNLTCLNHQRQLISAWHQYADENRGRLPGNAVDDSRTNVIWAGGWLSLDSNNRDNTNTALLLDYQLGAYTRDASLYRCPMDASTAKNGGVSYPRVRSVSMNCYLGPRSRPFTEGYRIFGNVADLGLPAQVFVFTDEHPGSINERVLNVDMRAMQNALAAVIVDYPASYHNGGAGISFADGHVELHLWADPRTKPPFRNIQLQLGVASPNNSDMVWLAQHASSKAD